MDAAAVAELGDEAVAEVLGHEPVDYGVEATGSTKTDAEVMRSNFH